MKKLCKSVLSAVIAVMSAGTVFSSPVSAAWKQSGTRWWYQNTDGSYCSSEWQEISEKWYFFDQDGWMQTGWQKVNDKWYYFNPAGDMATGWQKINDAWFYLNPDGSMATGWKKLGETWFYMNSSGVMQTGTQTINGKAYTFDDSGRMLESEQNTSQIVYWGETGEKYHIDPYCRSFKGAAAHSGSLKQAKANGRLGWCGICSKGWTDERLEKYGNPNIK